MKVLHLVFSYLPDAPGGTELYVDALCRHLRSFDVESVVVAPGRSDESYAIDGLRVRRFAADIRGLEDLYAGSAAAAAAIARLVDEEAPDLVHQHALAPACPAAAAVEARRRGVPVVFTYHTPTATCQRGTLIEFGRTRCDGRLEVSRCAACALDALGTGAVLSRLLAIAPTGGGDWLERAGREGGAWTALRMTSLIKQRHAAVREFFDAVDRIVVLAPWVGDVLRLNGIPREKLVASPHGVELAAGGDTVAATAVQKPLRLVHLGRLDPVKGTRLLIQAFKALSPDAAVRLDIYGIVQESGGQQLLDDLQTSSGADPRIRLLPPVPHDAVAGVLREYDVLTVPSQWMETGPLVVLEAFAAGIPVLGSALGGIADKVDDGVDGILVSPFNSTAAWTSALHKLIDEPGVVARLKAGVRRPRAFADVARDMHELYSSLAAPATVAHATVAAGGAHS